MPSRIARPEVLVGVYAGDFDDKGRPSSGENANQQFAFGFVRAYGSPDPYVRFPIAGFFDDGGSPVRILAVFRDVGVHELHEHCELFGAGRAQKKVRVRPRK